MSARFALATVMRVRRLQEELARAEAAQAQLASHRARSEHARREARLAGRPDPGSAVAAQWLASRSAALALAADARAARAGADSSAGAAAAALDGWASAAAARKGVEHLADAHADALRRAQERAEQLAADDRAGAVQHARRQSPDEPIDGGAGS